MKNQLDACVAVMLWTEGKILLQSEWEKGTPLSYEALEMIYEGIKRDYHQEKAFNFSCLIFMLNDLSIHPFSVAFEEFWASNFMLLSSRFQERQKHLENPKLYWESYFVKHAYNVSHFDEVF